MSIAVLRNPSKAHTILDDIESCFWLLLYMALHFFKKTSGIVEMEMFDEMKELQMGDGAVHPVGGKSKYSALTMGDILQVAFDSKPLTGVLHGFCRLLASLHLSAYMALQSGAQEQLEGHSMIQKSLEDMSEIFHIFDKALNDSDWPEGEDAVEDQYPKRTAMQEHKANEEAREQSYRSKSRTSHGVAHSVALPPPDGPESPTARHMRPTPGVELLQPPSSPLHLPEGSSRKRGLFAADAFLEFPSYSIGDKRTTQGSGEESGAYAPRSRFKKARKTKNNKHQADGSGIALVDGTSGSSSALPSLPSRKKSKKKKITN